MYTIIATKYKMSLMNNESFVKCIELLTERIDYIEFIKKKEKQTYTYNECIDILDGNVKIVSYKIDAYEISLYSSRMTIKIHLL